MRITTAERKQIENEMIFRRLNEKVGSDLDALDEMFHAEGNHNLVHDDLILIQFKCECSDENCKVRIPMKLSLYRQYHTNRNDFIVKPNHQVDYIERVIHREDSFLVVKKKHETPEPGDTLNTTTIDNSGNN